MKETLRQPQASLRAILGSRMATTLSASIPGSHDGLAPTVVCSEQREGGTWVVGDAPSARPPGNPLTRHKGRAYW